MSLGQTASTGCSATIAKDEELMGTVKQREGELTGTWI
jgi:hypothetical protein